jgi:hypothetical protein
MIYSVPPTRSVSHYYPLLSLLLLLRSHRRENIFIVTAVKTSIQFNSERHGATRQQAIEKTFAKRSAYQILS